MRRWAWRALLLAAVMAALTVGAAAAEVSVGGIKYDLSDPKDGTVVGFSGQVIKNAVIETKVKGVPITTIKARAFAGVGGLESISLPEGLTKIESEAFLTSGLKSVTLPSTLTDMGKSAFESCKALSQITISGGITVIGERAFVGCSNQGLKTISLPSSVQEIKNSAFENCSSLQSVALPENVTRIEQKAFNGCSGLTVLYLPSSVDKDKIGASAFDGCLKLQMVHYGGEETALADVFTDGVEIHKASTSKETGRDSTCALAGYEIEKISCNTCKKVILTENRPTSRLPHTEQTLGAVAATCSSTGLTEGKRCSVCKAILERQEVTERLEHQEEPIDPVDATCTAEGSKEGVKCSVCKQILKAPVPVPKLDHKRDETDDDAEDKVGEVTKEATCIEKGVKTYHDICATCKKPVVVRTEEIPLAGHTYDKDQKGPYMIREATCQYSGISVQRLICDVCGAPKSCADCDAIKEAVKDGADLTDAQSEHLETHGDAAITEKLAHVPENLVEDAENSTAATCTEGGQTAYKEARCKVCGGMFTPPPKEIPSLGGHKYKDVDEKTVREATCEEPGLKNVGGKECTVCGDTVDPKPEVIPALGHKWGAPVKDENPGEGKEDKAPTCGKAGVSHVLITCSVCGGTEHRAITLPANGQHDWGDWVITEPTLTQPGEKKRVCKLCEKEDKLVLPATGEPSGPDGPDTPTEPEQPKTYPITLVQGAGGAASVSRTAAQEGTRITVTLSPDSGYELDMIRAIGGGTDVLSLTDLGGGEHRFTMPAAGVEIRVTFARKNSGSGWASAPGDGSSGGDARRTSDVTPTQNAALGVPRAGASGQRFQDIPVGHWAAGEIQWANQMGYMNGTGGRFNPDGTITHQQMWMVLARLNGSSPANMAEARRWAVERSFADGSSPTAAVSRHQLVTALYRSAHLMGSSNRNTTSLAGYPDSRTVPAAAKDAFAWAVANGILSGTASGRLDPNGTLTRAQFAVILYRYSQRI